MIKKSGLGHIRTTSLDCDREIALRPDRQALRRTPYLHMIDNAWRIGLEVDDADRVGIAVGAPAVAVVGGERQLAVRRDGNVVRENAGRQVAFVVVHLLAVYRQQRQLVGSGFDSERPLAVG